MDSDRILVAGDFDATQRILARPVVINEVAEGIREGGLQSKFANKFPLRPAVSSRNGCAAFSSPRKYAARPAKLSASRLTRCFSAASFVSTCWSDSSRN